MGIDSNFNPNIYWFNQWQVGMIMQTTTTQQPKTPKNGKMIYSDAVLMGQPFATLVYVHALQPEKSQKMDKLEVVVLAACYGVY